MEEFTQQQKARWWLFSTLVLMMGLALWLVSCYPGEPLSPSDTDVITTFMKKGASFADKKTYALPDTVAYVDENDRVSPLDPPTSSYILDAIQNNMQKYGYTRVNNPDNADVVVAALATKTQWSAGTCYPWYWDWWWGYPGWCYPVAYTYDAGTIVIVMVEPNTGGGKATPLWIAAMNGLIDSNTSTRDRITRAIDQAFAQSPYLGEGK